jgi:Ca2+-binding EF-hand superfamily protein
MDGKSICVTISLLGPPMGFTKMETYMVRESLLIRILLVCGLISAGAVWQTATAAGTAPGTMLKNDTDNDETLDLVEVKRAASARFDTLDKDADGTLDPAELKNLIGPRLFKANDPDHDGTLTKDEYLVIVEKLFKKADVDNDGTLDVKELKTKAARQLQHLIS